MADHDATARAAAYWRNLAAQANRQSPAQALAAKDTPTATIPAEVDPRIEARQRRHLGVGY